MYTVAFLLSAPWVCSFGVTTLTLAFGVVSLFPTLYYFNAKKEMLIPVTLYSAFIILMLLTAINFEMAHSHFRSYPFVAIGAFLFCVSDRLLGFAKFVSDFPLSHFLILATYYSAQAFIAWGTLFQYSPTSSFVKQLGDRSVLGELLM